MVERFRVTDRRSSSLVDPTGRPASVPAAAPAGPGARPQALNGAGPFGGPAYDAADVFGQHLAAWNPGLGSPDNELNPYRDRIVARARDLVRNDGWASGAVTRVLDNAIGAMFRPISKPDYRALAAASGIAAFDRVWADEYGRAVDAGWRTWAEDHGRYCDAARVMNFRQIARVALQHELVDGDSLALVLWLPERVGDGRAHYATSVQLVDPDRLSNPNQLWDAATIRGGVEIDAYGAPVAYHIRRAHPGDIYAAPEALSWERVAREDEFGRPRVVHNYTAARAGQHRGGAGMLTPVIQRLKMLIRYDGVELDAAILNAVFGAYVESPMDPQLVAEAMGDGGTVGNGEFVGTYQQLRANYHDQRRITAGGTRMPIMYPGETIRTISAARPNSNFAEFEGALLRNVAAGTGMSAQQISNNWRDVNYSSARAALLEAWKTMDRRCADFGDGFAQPIRVALLEEMHEVDDLPLPKGAPEFLAMRGAYARCRWMRPGRGWVDPVKEKEGAILGLQAGMSTLEEESANQGRDWEEDMDQVAIELKKRESLGLPPPVWALPPQQQQNQQPARKEDGDDDA